MGKWSWRIAVSISSLMPGWNICSPAGDRHQLWEEKVGLVQPFAGNAATEWGTAAEPRALATYQAVTGQRIDSCMFQGGPRVLL